MHSHLKAYKIRTTMLLTTIIALSFPSNGALADNTKTLQDRLPNEVVNNKDQFLTFTIENDLFGSGTDQNYTNGARLTYFDVASTPPETAYFITNYLPLISINETSSTTYSIGQNLYTPENITTKTPDPSDRPYAAFLYGSASFTTLKDNHIDQLEMTLGVIGPAALGKEVQKFVHNTIDADNPAGWDHQLKNEPGVILSWERVWPGAYSKEFSDLTFSADPFTGFSAGNIYTYGSAGMTLSITPTKHKWQSPPPRVRPAMPGNGYFLVPENQHSWSLFTSVETRAIARNIFLDGNTFTDSPSVNKKHIVNDINAGVSYTYGRTQLSYTVTWRSKEFDNQKDPSIFGAISIGRRF